MVPLSSDCCHISGQEAEVATFLVTTTLSCPGCSPFLFLGCTLNMKQATQRGRGSFELIPLRLCVAVTGSIVQLEFSWNMTLVFWLPSSRQSLYCFPMLIYLAKLTYIGEINYPKTLDLECGPNEWPSGARGHK